GYAALAAELVATTARAMVGRRPLLWLFWPTAACVGVATAVTVEAIWVGHAGSEFEKLIAALWILTVLGYLLLPVGGRVVGAPPTADARRVDLAGGVELGGVRVSLLGHGARGRGDAVYVVLDGTARVAGLDLA